MVPPPLAGTALASLAACGVTGLGILVVSRRERWARRHAVYFMGFAAGVLVSVSLLHVVPRALELAGAGPAMLLAGFLGLYASDRLLGSPAGEDDEDGDDAYVVGVVAVIGIGLHSLVDGVIYAVTFRVDAFTGWLAALGMVLHEFPEGIVTFVLLSRGGLGRRRAMGWAFVAAAATTPLGALLAYPAVGAISDPALGGMLALSAGALIYVGASHLLPAARREARRYGIVAVLAGVLVAVAFLQAKG